MYRQSLWYRVAIVGVVTAILGLAVWFALPDSTRLAIATRIGLVGQAVKLDLRGLVLDVDGRPVPGARIEVKCQPIGGSEIESSLLATPDGTYHTVHFYDTPTLRQPDLRVKVHMRAVGAHNDAVPSAPIEFEAKAHCEHRHEFRLGPWLPTVPVHVRDGAGQPVTDFWLGTLAAEGGRMGLPGWPKAGVAGQSFADGISRRNESPGRASGYRPSVSTMPFEATRPSGVSGGL
jgi:hypothetical protein